MWPRGFHARWPFPFFFVASRGKVVGARLGGSSPHPDGGGLVDSAGNTPLVLACYLGSNSTVVHLLYTSDVAGSVYLRRRAY